MARCRLVVDGSSLGEFVHPGECTHRDLLHNLLLLRFCDRFSSLDISSAYMRLAIAEQDQYYMVIMWRGKAFRFASLPMGINCSASQLQSCVDSYLHDWLAEYKSCTNSKVLVAPYMDDLLQMLFPQNGERVKVEDERQARKSLMEFLEGRGMLVSKPKLFGSEESENGVSNKILGVTIVGDSFQMCPSVPVLMEDETVTRRKAVGILSSLYDPLGLVAELTFRAREIVRDTAGVAWSQCVSRELAIRVARWAALVNSVKLMVPRRVELKGGTMFAFCDASKSGIGVVILGKTGTGEWVRFFAKSALYKTHQRAWVGISSKIELLGLQLCLQTIQYVEKVIARAAEDVSVKWHVGTDSEVNLSRLACVETIAAVGDQWQKKVAAICSNGFRKLGAVIFHVKGADNPADQVSRGEWLSDSETKARYRRAVDHFSEERAFIPVKVAGDESAEIEESPPVVNVAALSVLDPAKLCMYERYGFERTGEQTREEWFRSYQDKDEVISKQKRLGLLSEVNGVLVRKGRQTLDGSHLPQILVPKVLVHAVLKTCHDACGHIGGSKTLAKVLDSYTWRGAARDVRHYVGSCEECQLVKGTRQWNTLPATLYSDGRPWSVVSCDLVKGFDDKILMVMVCMYTRYVHAEWLRSEDAASITSAITRVFLVEGPCRTIVTDNARAFIGGEFSEFMKSWGIETRTVPRYAGFYAGWYERQHATLVKMMAVTRSDRSDKFLRLALLYTNTRPYENSGSVIGECLSPFEVFKGRRVYGFFDKSMDAVDPMPTNAQFIENLPGIREDGRVIAEKFEEIWKSLRSDSFESMSKRVRKEEVFAVGDMVYCWIPKLLQIKDGAKWQGPYRVQERLTQSGTLLRVNDKVEHAYNLKKARTRGSGDKCGSRDSATPKRPLGVHAPVQGPGKRTRVAAAMVALGKPGGELLLI